MSPHWKFIRIHRRICCHQIERTVLCISASIFPQIQTHSWLLHLIQVPKLKILPLVVMRCLRLQNQQFILTWKQPLLKSCNLFESRAVYLQVLLSSRRSIFFFFVMFRQRTRSFFVIHFLFPLKMKRLLENLIEFGKKAPDSWRWPKKVQKANFIFKCAICNIFWANFLKMEMGNENICIKKFSVWIDGDIRRIHT